MNTLSQIAGRYIGIKEIGFNDGFEDQSFEEKLISLGWKKKQAWCVFFAQLCVEEYLSQFDLALIERYRKCFSPSATKTLNNFKLYFPEMVSPIAEENALCVFQKHVNGKAHWQGHINVLTDRNSDIINTIDGNTGLDKREGDGVDYNTWDLMSKPLTGLVFVGFINFPKL